MQAALIPIIAAIAGAGASYGFSKLDKGGAPGAGTPEQFRKMRTGTKEASNFQKQLFKTGGGLTQNPLYQQGADTLQSLLSNAPEAMQQFQAPYMENFSQFIMPEIMNRFAGMGTGASGLSSGGLQQTLAQAGRSLQKDLASMRSQQQTQAIPAAAQYAQLPISNMLAAMNWSPYQTTQTPRQPGIYDSLAQLAPGAIQSAMSNIDWGGMFKSNPQSTLSGYQNAIIGAS